MARSKGLNTSKIHSFYGLILSPLTKALESSGRCRNIFHSRCINRIFCRKSWNFKTQPGALLPVFLSSNARPPLQGVLLKNREPKPVSAGSGSPLTQVLVHFLAARYWNMT